MNVASVRVSAHRFVDDGTFPNGRFPALVYTGVATLTTRDPAAVFEQLFAANGWTGSWRNGVYGYAHYHSNTHEVLGIYRGSVDVRLGGPGGAVVSARAGDVLVIPAGVAHQNVGCSDDFGCVGAYPGGASPDMLLGKPGERPAADGRIARVDVPETDPVHGPAGALRDLWRAK